MPYHAPLAFTGSEKLIVTFAPTATPVAPLMGAVDATAGGKSPAGPKRTSSMASASSAPLAFNSLQRTHSFAPGATENPVTVPDSDAKLPGALPSRMPTAPADGGVTSSAGKFVHVPVASDVASVLYANTSLSAAASPRRQISVRSPISSDESTLPVSFDSC